MGRSREGGGGEVAGKEGMLGSISSRACWGLPAQALLPLDCTGNVWGREGWREQVL